MNVMFEIVISQHDIYIYILKYIKIKFQMIIFLAKNK